MAIVNSTCPINTKNKNNNVANRCPRLSKNTPPKKGMKKLGKLDIDSNSPYLVSLRCNRGSSTMYTSREVRQFLTKCPPNGNTEMRSNKLSCLPAPGGSVLWEVRGEMSEAAEVDEALL
jgi:hypothetical protein